MQDPSETLKQLKDAIGAVVVGQHDLVEGLLIGLLADGHVLVEGVPGLAKTTAVRTFAAASGLPFGRVQFTPDLLPGDLTGNPIFIPDSATFEVRRGPIFTSVLLADEINRAPAKVQSALLEAMEERQVTIGDESLPLPDPFLVMATQNPVEFEGTYPLPEAQLDRFLLKLVVDYPSDAEEREIVERARKRVALPGPVLSRETLNALRTAWADVHVADEVSAYAVALVRATRRPTEPHARPTAQRRRIRTLAAQREDAARTELPILLGASPRASIHLIRAASAHALIDGRSYTTPHDVKRVAHAVLRHRIVVRYEAEAEGTSEDDVIDTLLRAVPTP